MSGLSEFLHEARRRKVFRVAGLYIVAAWVTIQVFGEMFPAFEVPDAAMRFVWLGAVLGFPLALVFGWFYDVTAAGIVRTAPADPGATYDSRLRRADYIVLAGLAAVSVAIALQMSGRIRGSEMPTLPQEALSVAVLPLENLSGDPDQAYFVAGMHDALISALSRISGLRVTSRTSTLVYAGNPKSLRDVGRELGVANLIEGSVYRVDDQVRIIVQLIDAEQDDHLWEQTYERRIEDVLRLQADIAQSIADAVQVRLTSDERSRFTATRTVRPEAYEAFLQGKFFAEQFTPEALQQAYAHYQRAVELDPDNALGWAGLARLCRFRLQAGLERPREAQPRCSEALLRALAADDSLADVHMGLALGFWLYDYNWAAAENAFRKALQYNPSHAEARMFYSHFLANMGRIEASNEQIALARELDPMNLFIKALHGAQIALAGDLETGLAQIENVLRAAPHFGFGYDLLWGGYARLGEPDKSLEAARKHFGTTMGLAPVVEALDAGYAAGGFRQAMLNAAEVAVAINENRYVPAVEISMLYELGGDDDKAFAWLDTAYEQHDPTLPYIGVAPLFGTASGDPRYANLLRRLGFEHWIEAYGIN